MQILRFTFVLLAGTVAGQAHAAVDPNKPELPRMEFVPPAAGTYHLEHIQRAPDASLLDFTGQVRRLSSYTSGKITLLTFFYTYCVDPWGCPFAYQTLVGLRDRVLRDRNLAGQVRFVNVSFDPTNDTPEALRLYGERLTTDSRFEWRFLTAKSVAELLPVLDGFGQDVAVVHDENGRPTRTINHMLKMFLIDRQGVVREIYSLAFLQQQMMLNDIRTLARESNATVAATR